MNKRLISRLMRERANGLRNSGIYFFRADFEHVLRGIVLEYVPRGIYIWDFCFPLFDFFGPNLSYSHRLSDRPFIGKGEMSEDAIVDYVMASPEAHRALASSGPMDLPAFVDYLVESDCLLNPHARLIQAAALVLLGESQRALEILSALPPVLHPSDIPDCNRLAEGLGQGIEPARKLLEEVRQRNLQAFGLA